ncbi:unnamed protein product [Camellia sinensis]
MEGEKQKVGNNEVVVSILGIEETSRRDQDNQIGSSKSFTTLESGSSSFPKNAQTGSPNAGSTELQMSTLPNSSSPEITKSSTTPDRPLKIPDENVTRRRSIALSANSKPKSRLMEPYYPNDSHLVEESSQLVHSSSPYRNSPKTNASTPKENVKTTPVTPKTPLLASPGGQDDDDDVCKTSTHRVDESLFKCSGFHLVGFGSSGLVSVNRGVKQSRKTRRILNYVTMALASCLIGAGMWMAKTFLTLSGPPLMEFAERVGYISIGQLSFKNMKKGNHVQKEGMIDIEKLHKMKQEKISAWTMKGLIKAIRGSGLFTISNALDESVDDEGVEQKDKEFTSELEAKDAAYRIFKNVAKPGCKYIEEEDLLRFLKKEEVDNVLPMFQGVAETGKIKKSALRKWVVNVYNERKLLAHSLNDTKTAIEELNKILSGIILVVIIIVWLLLMGFATTQVLVFISSQLLLVAFMFGNTCKTVFEALIFVFVMHPFDVGDRCVIGGVQMVVEEMNILTTIFLRYDNEKQSANFYRSPEMSDTVEFAIDVSTSAACIVALKATIKGYLESKPQHWRPNHSVQVKDIEDVNKMKMALFVNHTINFQNYVERGNRRSDLVLELKKIFEELGAGRIVICKQVMEETTRAVILLHLLEEKEFLKLDF